MGQKLKVKNGPTIWELEEVTIGSRLQIAVNLVEETAPGSETFIPMNLDTKGFACEIKASPKAEVLPFAVFACVARNQITATGWMDLTIDGAVTGTFQEKVYEASLKVWPTGQPENGTTMLVIMIPAIFRATR